MRVEQVKRLVLEVGKAVEAVARKVEQVPPLHVGDDDRIRRFYREHGWVLVRNALDTADVERLREALAKSHAEKLKGDVLSNPHLSFIVDHPAVLSIVRSLIGPPTYFGDTSYSWAGDPPPGAIGFHKDCVDKEGDPSAPDWQGEYPILRVGFYLHDYSRWSGGLGIRDGSQDVASSVRGLPVAVPSRPGDAVVWSLRTTHSGFVSRMRGVPRFFLPLPVQKRLTFRGEGFRPAPIFRPAPPSGTRPTTFLTYGRRGPMLDRYLRYLETRQFAVETWQASRYSAEVLARAAANGVDVLEMEPRVRDLDVGSLDRFHVKFGT